MRGGLVPLIITLLLISIAIPSYALAPLYEFNFSTGIKTKCLLFGEMEMKGHLSGKNIPLDFVPINPAYFVSTPYSELNSIIASLVNRSYLSAIPMYSKGFATSACEDVYVINISDGSVQNFKNVEIYTDSMPIAIMSGKVDLRFTKSISYGILSFLTMQMNGEDVDGVLLLSDDNLNVEVKNGSFYAIVPLSTTYDTGEEGYAYIVNKNGNKVWEGGAGNWVIVVNKNTLPAELLPSANIIVFGGTEKFSVNVKKSNREVNITSLFLDVPEEFTGNGGQGIGSPFNFPDRYAFLLGDILNGAVLLFNSTDELSVGSENYNFSGFGLIRFDSAGFDIKKSYGYISTKGEGKAYLIFSGDEIYSDVELLPVGGFSLPLHPLALWILAIAFFLMFSVILKRKGERKIAGKFPLDIRDDYRKWIKYTFIGIYAVLFIATFFVFDTAFNEIFGVSFVSFLSRDLLLSAVVLLSEIVFIAI
ncbi:MAG TPA: hypothetical protein ENL44_02730, partial [Thermoplasmatales archaeon]|nr:hypothetical protein [Thermoplasmatales archaeon]